MKPKSCTKFLITMFCFDKKGSSSWLTGCTQRRQAENNKKSANYTIVLTKSLKGYFPPIDNERIGTKKIAMYKRNSRKMN